VPRRSLPALPVSHAVEHAPTPPSRRLRTCARTTSGKPESILIVGATPGIPRCVFARAAHSPTRAMSRSEGKTVRFEDIRSLRVIKLATRAAVRSKETVEWDYRWTFSFSVDCRLIDDAQPRKRPTANPPAEFGPARQRWSGRTDFRRAARFGSRGITIDRSATHIVQLVVESAGVADRLAGLVPPPEGRGGRLAVGAAGTRPSRRTLHRQFWKRKHTDITPVTVALLGRSSQSDSILADPPRHPQLMTVSRRPPPIARDIA